MHSASELDLNKKNIENIETKLSKILGKELALV